MRRSADLLTNKACLGENDSLQEGYWKRNNNSDYHRESAAPFALDMLLI